ncbi:hypothetical protein ZIOFF_000971 [Zingiber officinale]|uniref:Uncharacterized protein n=1 Tax=Zingiber officinale TaxID=94328 RepID=A0A8J5IJ29_ZINOF|nr:hypothetical protein ZIOFF_000971 [Zingiber officinale]
MVLIAQPVHSMSRLGLGGTRSLVVAIAGRAPGRFQFDGVPPPTRVCGHALVGQPKSGMGHCNHMYPSGPGGLVITAMRSATADPIAGRCGCDASLKEHVTRIDDLPTTSRSCRIAAQLELPGMLISPEVTSHLFSSAKAERWPDGRAACTSRRFSRRLSVSRAESVVSPIAGPVHRSKPYALSMKLTLFAILPGGRLAIYVIEFLGDFPESEEEVPKSTGLNGVVIIVPGKCRGCIHNAGRLVKRKLWAHLEDRWAHVAGGWVKPPISQGEDEEMVAHTTSIRMRAMLCVYKMYSHRCPIHPQQVSLVRSQVNQPSDSLTAADPLQHPSRGRRACLFTQIKTSISSRRSSISIAIHPDGLSRMRRVQNAGGARELSQPPQSTRYAQTSSRLSTNLHCSNTHSIRSEEFLQSAMEAIFRISLFPVMQSEEMESLCKAESSGVCSVYVVKLLMSEIVLAAQNPIFWLLLAVRMLYLSTRFADDNTNLDFVAGVFNGSLSSKINALGEGSDVRHMILKRSKVETMPENKDDGESDEEGDDDEDSGDDEEDDGDEEFSGEEGNDEGDEDDNDNETDGGGGSEEEDDDEDDGDNEDNDDEDNEDEEDDDEEEHSQPPSKKKK